MEEFTSALRKSGFKGDIINDDASKAFYSHDASIFEVVPELIVAPKDKEDVKKLVLTTNEFKQKLPNLSLTARSGGTCMSGGAINESVIVDFNKYMTKIGEIEGDKVSVQPGAFYRDFEKKTLEKGLIMPSYPASREICTVGGMLANNAGGEKSLEFGKVEKFVPELKVVFGDGKEYVVKPLTEKELDAKIAQGDYEGSIYKKVFDLVDGRYDEIKGAKPRVSKDSTGYHLWRCWPI